MIVCAVDPGAHCGIAVRQHDGSLAHIMIHDDLPSVLGYIHTVRPIVIVVERFVTAGRIGRDGLDTVEMQGSIFGVAWVLGSQLYWQTPADRMPFLSDSRQLIKANRSKIQSHDVDAVAHLLRWEWMQENGRQRTPALKGFTRA